jgi:hypothetical protein
VLCPTPTSSLRAAATSSWCMSLIMGAKAPVLLDSAKGTSVAAAPWIGNLGGCSAAASSAASLQAQLHVQHPRCGAAGGMNAPRGHRSGVSPIWRRFPGSRDAQLVLTEPWQSLQNSA